MSAELIGILVASLGLVGASLKFTHSAFSKSEERVSEVTAKCEERVTAVTDKFIDSLQNGQRLYSQALQANTTALAQIASESQSRHQEIVQLVTSKSLTTTPAKRAIKP